MSEQTTKPILLYRHEIRRLIDTGSVTVWRPIDRIGRHGKVAQFGPSDTPGYEWHFRCKRGLWQDYRDAELIKVAPHPPGSERWVRERCAIWTGPSDGVVYDDDPDWRSLRQDNEHLKAITQIKGRWKFLAARQMPRWASRLSVVSTAVQARQVQGVTEVEAEQTGVHPGGFASRRSVPFFREWWQSQYGAWNPDPWAWATTLTRKDEG